MPNASDPIADRILHHLEHAGRSPMDRFTLLRITAMQGDPQGAVGRALQDLILRGDVRRVGMLYMRVPPARTKPASERRQLTSA